MPVGRLSAGKPSAGLPACPGTPKGVRLKLRPPSVARVPATGAAWLPAGAKGVTEGFWQAEWERTESTK